LDIFLNNRVAELRRLHDEVAAFAQAQRLPPSVTLAVDLSLAEIVSNIISYGYGDKRKHQALVRLQRRGNEILIRVEDDARPFNPLLHPAPDTRAPIEERPIGGLGIFLVRKLMDSLEYRRRGRKNILLLRKRVTGAA
jgi:anti-sigma regulatory factor (Ser/Thr protein kinase)